MTFEVELKYRADDIDEDALRSTLTNLGAQQHAVISQCDRYFNHPGRDFGQTDEALRIRQTDGQYRITYKGPKIDPIAKTRREIELSLADDDSGDKLAEILLALGFRETLSVPKSRETWTFTWQGLAVEVVIDTIDQLGQFLELETTTDDDDTTPARDALLQLASTLGLHTVERRSYLEMLLDE